MHHPRFRLRPAALALALVLSLPVAATSMPVQDAGAAPATGAAAPALPARLQSLDEYVGQVRERFDVPGIAVAIVKDGEVLLERGYGVKDLESGEPVDARTLFAIASNTKAFTSAALSMLADEGKLELEDRVIDHLPWFRMADPYITREMRVRDLLVHRSGLPLGAGDLLYWPTSDYSTARWPNAWPRCRSRAASARSTPTTTSCSALPSWWSRRSAGSPTRTSCSGASSIRWAWRTRASTPTTCAPATTSPPATPRPTSPNWCRRRG